MRKAKLPSNMKGGTKCKNCKAIIIKSYDYFNGIYKYKCGNCGQERYESGVKFKTRFVGASDL